MKQETALTFVPSLVSRLIWGVLLTFIIFPSWANAERPSFNSSRYEENYQFLHDPKLRSDFFDPIKFRKPEIIVIVPSAEEVFASYTNSSRIRFDSGPIVRNDPSENSNSAKLSSLV